MKDRKTAQFAYSLVAMAVFSGVSHAQETANDAAQTEQQQQQVEIIAVTANRRSQSITTVPYNISAIGGDVLKKAGVTDLGDLTKRIPGISYTDRGSRSGAFSSSIAMRGLSLEDGRVSGPLYTAPGVSTYVGETPLFANIRFYDIERVEVLRGPQGTLYGSGSLGGTLRFIPNAPDTEFGFLELDTAVGQTNNGDGLDHETNVVFNLPLANNIAVRGNLGVDDRAGWVDQPFSYGLDNQGIPLLANADNYLDSAAQFVARKGINDEESVYGRIAALWQVTDDTKITLAYNKQKDQSGGNPSRAVGYQDLDEYESAALTAEAYEGDTELVSLDMETHIGFATFTASVSSYESEQDIESDQTGAYQAFDFYAASYGAMPRPLLADFSSNDDKADIVEIRLVSDYESSLSWVIGGFYMDQDIAIQNYQFYQGYADWADACADAQREDCGLGTTTGTFSLLFAPGTHEGADAIGLPVIKDQNFIASSTANFKDNAIFGELTWAASDAVNLTAGFRRFDQEFSNSQVNAAIFVDTATANSQNAAEKDTLIKLNGSWQIMQEAMLYGTISEGFRRGGANALPTFVTVFDEEGNGTDVNTNPNLATYAPDTVTNKEIGIKGIVDATRYTLAFFDIDWQDIQLDTLVTPFLLNAVVNAGEANSRGVEVEIITPLTDSVDVTFGYSFVDATLDAPDVEGLIEAGIDPTTVAGVRLPGVAKHSASLDLNYNFEWDDWYGIWNMNSSYRSDTRSTLDPAISTETDGFSIWNTALTLEKDNWSVRLFVNNVFNEEGVLNTPHPGPAGPRRNELLSRSRMIGLNASYLFDF